MSIGIEKKLPHPVLPVETRDKTLDRRVIRERDATDQGVIGLKFDWTAERGTGHRLQVLTEISIDLETEEDKQGCCRDGTQPKGPDYGQLNESWTRLMPSATTLGTFAARGTRISCLRKGVSSDFDCSAL